MYYFELFDAVMFGIMMVLLIAFAVSVTHATMKTKMGVITEQLNWVGMEYSQAFEDCLAAQVWRDAVIDLCVINHISWDETNPESTLAFLLYVERLMALDPSISSEAAAMINKAKREHGKKVRKAADRKLERTEREYEQRLQLYKESLEYSQASNNILRGNLGEIRAELSAFQGIVGQELENFVRLPSVRNKMLAAINQQHKAWKEL